MPSASVFVSVAGGRVSSMIRRFLIAVGWLCFAVLVLPSPLWCVWLSGGDALSLLLLPMAVAVVEIGLVSVFCFHLR